MSKCTILAHVRRPDGSIVESELFKSLLRYTANRSQAKEHYAVATNQTFLDKVKDRATFDENGEITFESYKSIVGIEDNDKLLNTLNKDVGAGTYSYQIAINKLQNFNRNSPFSDKYMATIKEKKGKYEISVVKRTAANERALESVIHKQTLQDRIMYYLNKAGVSVDFIEKDGLEGGRYSTMNAQQTADGFYSLIQIAKGEYVTPELAEEAGHFAIGAMGDNPLVERLLHLLTTDVQKAILGEEYDNKVLGPNARREVAGVLVGRALQDNIDDKMAWQKLANRIATKAKKLFYFFKGDEVKRALLNAEQDAQKIAKGFMSPEFNGTIENAIAKKETLYSAKPNYDVTQYRLVTQRLQTLATQMANIANDKFSGKMEGILAKVEVGRGELVSSPDPNKVSDTLALSGIAEAISGLIDLSGPDKEIDRMLKSIDFVDVSNFMDHIVDNGRTLRQIRTFLQNSMAIQKIIEESLDANGKQSLTISKFEYVSEGTKVQADLRQALAELTKLNAITESRLRTLEFQFFARFLQDSFGEKYITTSTRVLFKKQGGKLIFKPIIEAGKTVDAKEVIESSLNHLDKDISLFERYLSSMSNSGDLVGQIIDKVSKAGNKAADDNTRAIFDELRQLRNSLETITGSTDTSFLYERDNEGKLTGNIISPKNWGEWEKNRQAFLEREKAAFKEANPDLRNLPEIERALMWDMWLRPKMREWNKDNSVFDKGFDRMIPNDNYLNSEFDKAVPLHSELRVWYNKYMDLKGRLDKVLPEGSTLSVRMPQFKGTFVNKTRNRHLFESRSAAIKHTLRSSLLETFCESSEDQDYGSLMTYNSEDEALYYDAIEYEKEKMDRLPLFGINKLKDMNDLSTDLFHTTLAYASMAFSYKASSLTVDTLEVGKEVLLNRKVGGINSERETNEDKSRAYNRYLKFLEKQVYGVSAKPHIFGKNNVVWEKLVSATGRLSAVMFLGGNVQGGLVNTGTGAIEIFKEAMSGEYYDMEDWRKANGMYFGSFVKNAGEYVVDYGRRDADNTIALFVRYFNVLGENRQAFREWETKHSWLYNVAGKALFFPYKSGDHYMQCMSYLALGNHIKLYDKEGNEMSLLQAYKPTDIDPSNEEVGKTLQRPEGLFKSKENIKTYKMLEEIIDALKQSSLTNPTNLTQEQQDYLASHNYPIQNKENTIRLLTEDMKRLIWSEDDESAFMDRAREINNRLHGIYNKQDQVAFSQSWYGSAFLAMKGWALGMMERRFARDHYNILLGQQVEGSLNTVHKTVRMMFDSKQNFMRGIQAIMLPFGKDAKAGFMKLGFSANQWANMKRNAMDLYFMLALFLIRAMSALPPDEDDDEYWKSLYGKNWQEYKNAQESDKEITLGLLHYFSNRLYREQSALNNPAGMYYESNTLLDVVPAGFSALFDIVKLGYESVGAIFASEEDKRFYYQSSKEGRYEEGDTKAFRHLLRYIPYYKSLYTFFHPYEATESYEYGRNVKNR